MNLLEIEMNFGPLRFLAELQHAAYLRTFPPKPLDQAMEARAFKNWTENIEDVSDHLYAKGKPLTHEEILSIMFSRDTTAHWEQAKSDCLRELSSSMDEAYARKEIDLADHQAQVFMAAYPHLPLMDYPFWVTQKYKIRIKHSAEILGCKIPDNFVAGNVYTGFATAAIVKEPYENGYVIIFDSALKLLTNYMCKLFVAAFFRNYDQLRALASKSNNPHIATLAEVIAESPEFSQAFYEIFEAYYYVGDITAGRRIRVTDNEHVVANIMEQCMETFIVGHEFGHFSLNHLERSTTIRSKIDGSEVEEIKLAHNEEFEADRFGLVLMLHACSGVCPDRVFAVVGASLFFSILQVVETTQSLVFDGVDQVMNSRTHPPARLRQRNLLEIASVTLKNNWPESVGPAMSTASLADDVCQAWLRRSKEKFQINFNTNRSLASMWTSFIETRKIGSP